MIEAIRAQAVLAPVPVCLVGTAPHSSPAAEEAVYFACPEALQNVAKHARRPARVEVRVGYCDATLAVRIVDDGGGFVRGRRVKGAGLTNIRDRVASAGGSVRISSTPGRGTIVAMSLPWPTRLTPQTAARATSLSSTDGTRPD